MTTTKQLTEWLVANGFEKVANRNQYVKGAIRVALVIDEVVLLAFTDTKFRATAWELRFAAPEGVLSAPESVIAATITAAVNA